MDLEPDPHLSKTKAEAVTWPGQPWLAISEWLPTMDPLGQGLERPLPPEGNEAHTAQSTKQMKAPGS